MAGENWLGHIVFDCFFKIPIKGDIISGGGGSLETYRWLRGNQKVKSRVRLGLLRPLYYRPKPDNILLTASVRIKPAVPRAKQQLGQVGRKGESYNELLILIYYMANSSGQG